MIGTKKGGSITEDDTALLLQRYTATTILALLQEVSQFAGAKIDWNALVKRTTTGIQSAREYQMLWRHLAYRDALVEKIENGAEPLDDDSDLEFELETSPNVTYETASEAATAVKVLMTHGWASDPGPSNRSGGEAHLPLNGSNGQALHASCENMQVARNSSALDVKQSLPTVSSSDGMEGNGPTASANYPPRRKRKLWTPEEDMELIAAVQKCGEGNWANILKGDFKHDRTASQLSQRWAIIRKKQASLNPVGSGNMKGSTLSEAQLAAQAVSIAIDMPMMRNLSTVGQLNPSSVPATTSNVAMAPVLRPPCPPKPRSTQKKSLASTPMKCSIQEVAVAAGARIANPSTAASLLKAAQSKNAVHIKQGSPPTIGNRSSNIHYIRTAPVVSSVSRPANQGVPRRPIPSGQPAVSSRTAPSNPPTQPDNRTETPTTGSSSSQGETVQNEENNLGTSEAASEALIPDKTDSKADERQSLNQESIDKVTMASSDNPATVEMQTETSVTEADENQKMVEGAASLPVSDAGEQTCGEPDKDQSNHQKIENQSVAEMGTGETEKVVDSSQPLAESSVKSKEVTRDPALMSEPPVEVETGVLKEEPNEIIVKDGEAVNSNPSS